MGKADEWENSEMRMTIAYLDECSENVEQKREGTGVRGPGSDEVGPWVNDITNMKTLRRGEYDGCQGLREVRWGTFPPHLKHKYLKCLQSDPFERSLSAECAHRVHALWMSLGTMLTAWHVVGDSNPRPLHDS